MRDIKFRYVYRNVDTNEIKIVIKDIVQIEKDNEPYLDGWVLISRDEFTGLTDKNGKEIYEGDILEYDTGKRYVVVYSIEAFDSGTNEHYIGAYMLRDDHNFHELICNVTRPYKYAEIIGNIHDNPELLTK